ncbi:hypothetical protein ACLBOM_25310 [Escherichia coli]
MNAMGSDYIREVNVVKSLRMLVIPKCCWVFMPLSWRQRRNTLIWLPTDGDAENFMKTHVEPTIRDIPLLLALAPVVWQKSTGITRCARGERFSNGRGFWCLGGKAAKNCMKSRWMWL